MPRKEGTRRAQRSEQPEPALRGALDRPALRFYDPKLLFYEPASILHGGTRKHLQWLVSQLGRPMA